MVNEIARGLSLRLPQESSLEILARVCELLSLEKGSDATKELAAIQAEYPTVTDFERDFPSLCFALATGVGKTRLMGAFILYLMRAKLSQHFFVLAPNLTIYEKLIRDFTPNTEKYVFKGVHEFVNNAPQIVTGDSYGDGRAARHLLESGDIQINIFNIAKITSTETPKGAVKSNTPRFRKFAECIGESYFDYLSQLDDLVLLMDESHRYRASAGMRAIQELKPILGLELTATPQVEKGAKNPVPFKNVIYDYPLANALRDEFIKTPSVLTRDNFEADQFKPKELERLKLEDGAQAHEAVKTELEVYAKQKGVRLVKPFMLVVAQDTTHADELLTFVQSPEFCEGRYKGKAIQVHSNQSGAVQDETIAELLKIERADSNVEIVVHVNMLKEGWDVNNLYTIVPLRAANSKTLVEQSIGRGLRLPFGTRTNVKLLDQLIIAAHDNYREIVAAADDPKSIIRRVVVLGKDIPTERQAAVTMEPRMTEILRGYGLAAGMAGTKREIATPFRTQGELKAAAAFQEAVRVHRAAPGARPLQEPEVQAAIVREAEQLYESSKIQGELSGVVEKPNFKQLGTMFFETHLRSIIDIPRVRRVPIGEVTTGFHDFDLDLSAIHPSPVPENLLLQTLDKHEQTLLAAKGVAIREARLERYLTSAIEDFDDINYDENTELINKLALQVVAHLQGYLSKEEAMNALFAHRTDLADKIHAQMEKHRWEKSAGDQYECTGFADLADSGGKVNLGNPVRDFRKSVVPKSDIQKYLFEGFERCLWHYQKFGSDPERVFAVILENAKKDVLKWFRPPPKLLCIAYNQDQEYVPDFVVEARKTKYICEVKDEGELEDGTVQAKQAAARAWCDQATKFTLEYDGKGWQYMLVPDSAIAENVSFEALVKKYSH